MNAKKFIRILCEGDKTEPNYFRGLIKSKQLQGARIVKPKDNSPLGVVRAAKREVAIAKSAKIPKADQIIWAGIDKDQHANLANAIKMAEDNNIKIAFSNVCFEFWVLLHFEKCTKPFRNCDEIIKYIRKNYDSDYLKNNDHFERLKDKIEIAITNNKWLIETHWNFEIKNGTPLYDINPYTDVFHLVKLLQEL